MGLEVGGEVFGKVIALLVVSAGFGVLGGAGVEGFVAMFIVLLSPFGPYKRYLNGIELNVFIPLDVVSHDRVCSVMCFPKFRRFVEVQ